MVTADILELQQSAQYSRTMARAALGWTFTRDPLWHWRYHRHAAARKERLARQLMGLTEADQLYS